MPEPVVFVVGDLLLDHYVEGRATHVAPDAPVMVMVRDHEYTRPGGMWNAAANVRASGVTLRAFGVDGEAGDWRLRDKVQNETFGPDECLTIVEPGRRTQTKTRYLGQYGFQMMRADTPKDGPIGAETFGALMDAMERVARRDGAPHVVFVADYGCGVVTGDLIGSILHRWPHAVLVADPYPTTRALDYRGVGILTPNRCEALGMVGQLDETDEAALLRLSGTVVVKNGGDPLTVYRRDAVPFHVRPPQLAVVDPCGAGDAFTAYLCAQLARGANVETAVDVAAHAGACAVSHRGVHVVTPAEVSASLDQLRFHN